MRRGYKIIEGATIEVRPSVTLKSNEYILPLGVLLTDLASTFSHRKDPLASGDITHIVNQTTGVDLPLVMLAGFTYNVLGIMLSVNQPAETYTSLDGELAISSYVEDYSLKYITEVLPDYYPLDPMGLFPHPLDMTIRNLGAEVMKGFLGVMVKVKAVGTKVPKNKKVKCRKCGHVHPVNRKKTEAKCPKCKESTLYYPIIYGYG